MHRSIFCLLLLFPCLYLQAAPAKQVKLVTSEWPPYVTKELQSQGYVYRIVSQAFQAVGYKTSITYMPWSKAINLSKNHADAYFPSYDRRDDKNTDCSAPIFAGPIGLYKRTNSPIQYTIKDPAEHQLTAFRALSAYRFGVVRGYKNTKTFDQISFLNKIYANNDYKNLQNLKNGKVDLAMSDIFVANYLMRHHPEIAGLTFMGPSLENKDVYVCFSTSVPNAQEKLRAFNRGLALLKGVGSFDYIIDAEPQ